MLSQAFISDLVELYHQVLSQKEETLNSGNGKLHNIEYIRSHLRLSSTNLSTSYICIFPTRFKVCCTAGEAKQTK